MLEFLERSIVCVHLWGMPKMYVIAGCNGAGKTTIAKTLLPNYFNCTEFVNADIIANELAPWTVESVAIRAGRMTISLVQELFHLQTDFAIETTISGRLHQNLVKMAQEHKIQ